MAGRTKNTAFVQCLLSSFVLRENKRVHVGTSAVITLPGILLACPPAITHTHTHSPVPTAKRLAVLKKNACAESHARMDPHLKVSNTCAMPRLTRTGVPLKPEQTSSAWVSLAAIFVPLNSDYMRYYSRTATNVTKSCHRLRLQTHEKKKRSPIRGEK